MGTDAGKQSHLMPELLQKLLDEIADLKRRIAELEKTH
jgi:hypothetical protein